MICFCENCGSDYLDYEVKFHVDDKVLVNIATCNDCGFEHVLGDAE